MRCHSKVVVSVCLHDGRTHHGTATTLDRCSLNLSRPSYTASLGHSEKTAVQLEIDGLDGCP